MLLLGMLAAVHHTNQPPHSYVMAPNIAHLAFRMAVVGAASTFHRLTWRLQQWPWPLLKLADSRYSAAIWRDVAWSPATQCTSARFRSVSQFWICMTVGFLVCLMLRLHT